ncbi:MAG: hypothetical protein KF708_08375 [Pirellulales bacterium]|nr:hypothetical protein [Pirellulales bacterium]
MVGENLDLSSGASNEADSGAGSSPGVRRRFVGIHFACCDIYSRIYINRAGTAYLGHCPRCSRRVELKIGPGGTDSRFFTVW